MHFIGKKNRERERGEKKIIIIDKFFRIKKVEQKCFKTIINLLPKAILKNEN